MLWASVALLGANGFMLRSTKARHAHNVLLGNQPGFPRSPRIILSRGEAEKRPRTVRFTPRKTLL